MIIDEEVYCRVEMNTSRVDDFFAHHGIKGMKWGVRKSIRNSLDVQKTRKLNKYGDPDKTPLTRDQKKARYERRVRRVSAGVKLTAGALFVAAIVAQVKASDKVYTNTKLGGSSKPTKTVKDFINDERNVKVSAIIRTHKEGHIDKNQLDNFLKTINSRYDRKIVDAMKNVK